jgi:hypothetical protein
MVVGTTWQVGRAGETQGRVRVVLQLLPLRPAGGKVGREQGGAGDGLLQEVEEAYFPPSPGNAVTLYQVENY